MTNYGKLPQVLIFGLITSCQKASVVFHYSLTCQNYIKI